MRKFNQKLAGLLLLVLLGCLPLSSVAAKEKLVLVWGDSLSAAYGMDVEQGWVALLRKRLEADGIAVINGSVSGETTAGGLTRLPEALQKHQPTLVILELGANDGLRALPATSIRKNLQQMINLAHKAGAKVLLLGMKIPPNYGPVYTRQFENTYSELAQDNHLPLIEFFLDGVVQNAELMQRDNLHPNEKAQPRLLEKIWPALSRLLD